MSALQASCPSCGGPVTFKKGSSIVVICEFCHSVVARGDRRLEDLGKVAELIDTGSPLQLGLKGAFQNVPFEITGHAQLGHQAGGIWDEWYASFADGRWGWLAEAQGRFYLTFLQPLPDQALIPPYELLQVGQPVTLVPGGPQLVAYEKGEARMLGAAGEIPYRLIPGETYNYADLAGPRGAFATLDYSEGRPMLFMGREVGLADLNFPADVRPPERDPRIIGAFKLSCPNCGGPLELRAPDHTERVTCPNCGSLLDVNQGRLSFLRALGLPRVAPRIPIGTVGKFDGGDLTVIGFMQRSVAFEGKRYYWEEYLLYNPAVGFRWLVCSDDNWSFVQPVSAGEIIEQGRNVTFDGRRYKLYQDAVGRVEHVAGEFYWKVEVGEEAWMADFIHPPFMLSKEMTHAQRGAAPAAPGAGSKQKRRKQRGAAMAAGEINWSLGTYVKPGDVEKTFGITGLPRTSKVAPNQPFPHKAIYKNWLLLMALALIVGVVLLATGPRRKVFEQTYQLEPLKNAEGTQVVFSEPFDLQDRRNIRIAVRSNISNSWMYLDGDLINEDTGLVQAFSMPVEYYYGVEDGESWSEGTANPDTFLSALPTGKYTLRLEVSWEKWQQPAQFSIRIEQGVPRVLYLVLTLVGLSIIPFFVAIYHFNFEKKRWEDSDYSPYESSD